MGKNIIERAENVSENTSESMLRLVCALNGINYEQYYNSITMFNEFGLGPTDPNFIELSAVDWESQKSINQGTMLFRTKFLTLLFVSILGKSNKLIKNTKKRYDVDNNKERAKLAIDLNLDFYKSCHKVAYDSCADKNWSTGLINLNSILIRSMIKDGSEGVIRDVSSGLDRILNGIKYNPVEGRLLDNSGVMYHLLRLAYVLITYDAEYSKMLSSNKFVELNINSDLTEVMFKYGKKLGKYIGNNKKSINPMFTAYLKANPRLYTNMKVGDNPEIDLTLYALSFLKFILVDDKLNAFIDHIMNTKLKFGKKLPRESARDIKGYISILFPGK